MRYHCALAVIACSGTTALVGADDRLRLVNSIYHSNLGGEFQVTAVSGISPGQTGMSADLSFDSFETFCMQADEPIFPGNEFNFVINTGVPFGVGGFDPLDPRTAYLFTNFRNGTLPGFDYSPGGRVAAAGALQDAIWFIEGESLGVNNAFVAQADAAVGPGGVWEGKGIASVRVLNLFSLDGAPIQDQLTIVPTPGSMALVGTACLVAARRRR